MFNKRAAMYAVAGAAVAVFQYPDVIPDDPFGEIISKLLILVVYVILVFGLTLMLISVVFPELIISTTWLKRLAVVGLMMVVTVAVTEIFSPLLNPSGYAHALLY